MDSEFLMRRFLYLTLILLSFIAFSGCGMSSILVDEDAGNKSSDAGDSIDMDASDEDAEDTPPDGCGDGIIDGRLGEACEGSDAVGLGGATCRSLNKGNGILQCDEYCQFDFSLCTTNGGIPGDGGVIGDGGTIRFGDGGTTRFGDGGVFRPTRRDGGIIF